MSDPRGPTINILLACAATLGLLLSADAEARSPANRLCEVSKKQKKRAVRQARGAFKRIKKVAADPECLCPRGSRCDQVWLRFAPFKVVDKKSKVTFQVQPPALFVTVEGPADASATVDDPFDFPKLAQRIRSLPVANDVAPKGTLHCALSFDDRDEGELRCSPSKKLANGEGHGPVGSRLFVGRWRGPSIQVAMVQLRYSDIAQASAYPTLEQVVSRGSTRAFVKAFPDASVRTDASSVSLTRDGNTYIAYSVSGRGLAAKIQTTYRVPASIIDDSFDGWSTVAEAAGPFIEKAGASKVTVVYSLAAVSLELPEGKWAKLETE